MPRMPHPSLEASLLADLVLHGEGAPSIDEKVALLARVRDMTPDGTRVDRVLVEQLARMTEGLAVAQEAQREFRALLERLDTPPWHPALFLGTVPTSAGLRAMVHDPSGRRIVAVADGIDLDALLAGEEVFLGRDGNVLAGRSPYGAPRYGETAVFERCTSDGRCVLRVRDEEVVVQPAADLAVATLRPGDQVRWDRAAWIAFEKIDGMSGRRFLLDEVPDARREQVGGQDAALETLLAALTVALVDPAKAALYGLGGRRSILMVGAPGCGKTLMARVAAAEVQRLGGPRCRFAVVKPAEWESQWVGETQQNIRNCFRALRETLGDGCAVLFLDEIESIGRVRGGAANQHSDKFLAALLAEIDGFSERANVAIVAATNRKDLVDPALLERLSDVEIVVPRPTLGGARAIFDIHLAETIPVAPGESREEIIEAAVTRVYGPNADNALSTIRFRDGKARTVYARELASGRLFGQVCRTACQRAYLRDVREHQPGLRLVDMEHAVAETLERLATTLSRVNAGAYLADLPQDVDVVAVEPIVRRVARPFRYRNAA